MTRSSQSKTSFIHLYSGKVTMILIRHIVSQTNLTPLREHDRLLVEAPDALEEANDGLDFTAIRAIYYIYGTDFAG